IRHPVVLVAVLFIDGACGALGLDRVTRQHLDLQARLRRQSQTVEQPQVLVDLAGAPELHACLLAPAKHRQEAALGRQDLCLNASVSAHLSGDLLTLADAVLHRSWAPPAGPY